MSLSKKFVKDVGLVSIAQILTNIAGLAFLPILTKSLPAVSFGTWAQLIATLMFLAPLALLGITNATIRFIPALTEKKEIQEHVWSSAVFVGCFALTIAFLLVIFAQAIGNLINIPAIFVVILAFILIIEALLRLFLSFFQAFQEAEMLSFFMAVIPIGEISLISLALKLKYGLWGAVGSIIFVRSLIFLLMVILVLLKIGISLPRFSNIKQYLQYSFPTFVGVFAFQSVNISNQYIIGATLGIAFVGYYASPHTISTLLSLLYLPLVTILSPLLAKLFAQKHLKEVEDYLSHTLKYMLFLLIPAVLGISVLSRRLLEILSTREIANNAYILLPLMGLAMLFYGIYAIIVQILSLYLKTNLVGIIWVVTAIINFFLGIFLIPAIGIVGAGISMLVAFIFATGATWYANSRLLILPIDWKAIGKSIVSSAVMAVVILVLNPTDILLTIFAILFGILVYFLSMYLLKAFNHAEIRFIKSIFKIGQF